jgi:hypothetical protein
MSKIQRVKGRCFLGGRTLETGDVILLATDGNYHGITFPDPLRVRVTYDDAGSLHLKTCAPLGIGERQVDIPYAPEDDLFSWPPEKRT